MTAQAAAHTYSCHAGSSRCQQEALKPLRPAGQFLARVGSRTAVFADLLQPAQYEIGELWYRGEIGIEAEHRA